MREVIEAIDGPISSERLPDLGADPAREKRGAPHTRFGYEAQRAMLDVLSSAHDRGTGLAGACENADSLLVSELRLASDAADRRMHCSAVEHSG